MLSSAVGPVGSNFVSLMSIQSSLLNSLRHRCFFPFDSTVRCWKSILDSLTEPDSKEREFREELVIQIDESGSSLRNEAGQVFSVDEAVFYILRPFLHLRAGCS